MDMTPLASAPVRGTIMTAEYIKHIAPLIYLWGWPMVNVHNRVAQFRDVSHTYYMNGIAPVAPVNHLCMLTDYIKPEQRAVTCPNQDVVYGIGAIDLAKEPLVIQVPDFGDRFWLYQICDERTDSFGRVGKVHDTKPGFYLLADRDWEGEWPEGISGVFVCPTNLGIVMPRVFQWDDPEDNQRIQPLLRQIMLYPLSQFDGQMKTTNWSETPSVQVITSGQKEVAWVKPEYFFDQLPAILKEVPPMSGEEIIYEHITAFLSEINNHPELKLMAIQAVVAAEQELVDPLFEFVNVGYTVANHWTTLRNGAQFGTDYLTRTACAKSNIFVNQPNETRYFYLDLDCNGERLNGSNAYTVNFAKDQLPPVKGFWSLTVYNEVHFFSPNAINRYSVGTKNHDMVIAPDGSLTIHVQHDAPADGSTGNWLPVPEGKFSLYLRCYWPEEILANDQWTPPAAVKTSK